MPLDHYVTLGNSGLRVSPLCLGAMTFGKGQGPFAEVSKVDAALAAGLTPVYRFRVPPEGRVTIQDIIRVHLSADFS